MSEKAAKTGRFRWSLLLLVAIVGFIVFISIAICPADTPFLLNVFVIGPMLIVASIAVLIYAVVRRRRQLLSQIAAMILVLWAVAVVVFLYDCKHPFEIRENARWYVWSGEYKHMVLAQPTSANGDLQHIEFDASGFAGIADNTAYLVFDPVDTLSGVDKSHQPAKFNGISCEVRAIRRLENHWYVVLFYTDQVWGHCN